MRGFRPDDVGQPDDYIIYLSENLTFEKNLYILSKMKGKIVVFASFYRFEFGGCEGL